MTAVQFLQSTRALGETGARVASRTSGWLRSPHVGPRLVGLLYQIATIATFAAYAIAAHLRDKVNAQQTGINFVAHDDRVLWLVYATLIGAVATTGVVAHLDVLFRPVNKRISRLASFFGLTGAVVQAILVVFVLGARDVVTDGRLKPAFAASESNALADVGLNLFFYGVYVAMLFLGIYGVYIGYLTFKSGFLPRVIGFGVSVSGLVWALLFVVPYLFGNSAWDHAVRAGFIGPIALSCWLMIVGLNEGQEDVPAPASIRDDDPSDAPSDTNVSLPTLTTPTENITGRPKLVR
jgi:hypothetical protein